MQTRSVLNRADYEAYLITLYFGSGADHLIHCLDRAYRDFSRTLRGLRLVETKSHLYIQARNDVHQQISSLRDSQAETIDQRSFDHWHQLLCKHLALRYAEHDHHFYVGQAQKWINMAFKYIFTMGEQRLPGFERLYPFCHVPLDNILLVQMSATAVLAPSSIASLISIVEAVTMRTPILHELDRKLSEMTVSYGMPSVTRWAASRFPARHSV